MKKVSSKRAVQLRHYDRVKEELEKELKDKGEWVCIFSGLPIPDHFTWKETAWHHLVGRDGDLLTDVKFLRPCANEFHTGEQGYHNTPFSKLKTFWWWEGFLRRVKAIDYDLWYSLSIK